MYILWKELNQDLYLLLYTNIPGVERIANFVFHRVAEDCSFCCCG
jgi:hypothetical protein